MKKDILKFLRNQREELRADIGMLESGAREVLEVTKGLRINVTRRALQRLLDRLSQFEEMIAAYEAGVT